MAEETVEARAEAKDDGEFQDDREFQDGGEEEAHLWWHEQLGEDAVEGPWASCYLGALPVELASRDMAELGEDSVEEASTASPKDPSNNVEEEMAYPGVKEELWEYTMAEEAHSGFQEELLEDTVAEAHPGFKEELSEDTMMEAHPGFKEELGEDTVQGEAYLKVKEELREDTMEEGSSSEAVAYAQPVGCHTEARPVEEDSGWI